MAVVGVDIGGATTDIFSVFKLPGADETVFNRTVSANLGMSYSVSNVMAKRASATHPALGAVPVDELEPQSHPRTR